MKIFKKRMKKNCLFEKNRENKRVYFPVDWRYCWCKAINLAINCGYTDAIEWDLCKFVFSLWSSSSSSFWSNSCVCCSFDGGYCNFDPVHCHGTVFFAVNFFAQKKTLKKINLPSLCSFFVRIFHSLRLIIFPSKSLWFHFQFRRR